MAEPKKPTTSDVSAVELGTSRPEGLPMALGEVCEKLEIFLSVHDEFRPLLEADDLQTAVGASIAIHDDFEAFAKTFTRVYRSISEYQGGLGLWMISLARVVDQLRDQWKQSRQLRLTPNQRDQLGGALEALRDQGYTKEEEIVLRMLFEEQAIDDASRVKKGDGMDRTESEGLSKRGYRKALDRLKERGLVDVKSGERGGACLTARGLRAANLLPRDEI